MQYGKLRARHLFISNYHFPSLIARVNSPKFRFQSPLLVLIQWKSMCI